MGHDERNSYNIKARHTIKGAIVIGALVGG